jgi:methylenetetrahydrofolate dehydrogenase (NADP+)/methenyltetrahydrofolate cyclohydrolase
MSIGLETFIPATPFGILNLLKEYKVETEGKHCVVMGRSNIVGTPMSILMSRNSYPGNCTVTMVHSRTKNIKEICQDADILIVALGRAEMVDASYVKEGAVIVDVGITRIADDTKKSGFRLAGDVNFEAVKDKCSFITPVPGGVGPMTITGLMMNTLQAAKRKA